MNLRDLAAGEISDIAVRPVGNAALLSIAPFEVVDPGAEIEY